MIPCSQKVLKIKLQSNKTIQNQINTGNFLGGLRPALWWATENSGKKETCQYQTLIRKEKDHEQNL